MFRKTAPAPAPEEENACLHCHVCVEIARRVEDGRESKDSTLRKLGQVIADVLATSDAGEREYYLGLLPSYVRRRLAQYDRDDVADARAGGVN